MSELPELEKICPARQPLVDFLASRRVMTLATAGKDGPHSTPVFYAMSDQGETLIFMSKISSRHSQHISLDPRAAASVYMETKDFGKTQGAQLTGIVKHLTGTEMVRARKIYYREHSMAKVVKPMRGNSIGLYAFRVFRAKLTDSRFGFGKPKIWEFSTICHDLPGND